jgi:RNA-binding protein
MSTYVGQAAISPAEGTSPSPRPRLCYKPVVLTGKQRRRLRALGHHLEPVVQVGKEGASETVAQALDAALLDHELVKVRLGENAPGDRHDLAAALAAASGSEVAQVLGRTVLLYRPHPEDPQIDLD